MISNCNINDINKIIKLGKLINNNFDKVNNIENIINNKEIIGYYYDNKLVSYLIYKKNYEIIDLLYIVVEPTYRKKGIASKLLEYLINNGMIILQKELKLLQKKSSYKLVPLDF